MLGSRSSQGELRFPIALGTLLILCAVAAHGTGTMAIRTAGPVSITNATDDVDIEYGGHIAYDRGPCLNPPPPPASNHDGVLTEQHSSSLCGNSYCFG
jgi:hypothetical protein